MEKRFNRGGSRGGVEIEFDGRSVRFDKVLNSLDEFVLNFADRVSGCGVDYVVVSGYIPILFGRSRNTEDVDMLIEKVGPERFAVLWEKLEGYDCLNAGGLEKAYDYLKRGTAVRFSKRGSFIPNVKVKFVSNEAGRHAMKNALDVRLKGREVRISPLELQIAYKLFLGSEKDIEDARFLFKLLEEHLDREVLAGFIRQFEIPEERVEMLGGFHGD